VGEKEFFIDALQNLDFIRQSQRRREMS